ncbi:MAG: MBL fold metallo-hydrolase [Marinisporobacter sp.]|jgi:beta-lactamase superfamily II metal-dependent hydrolase|nr:MBL fold metallo-hydrolase [Marinisporobacter sp.]
MKTKLHILQAFHGDCIVIETYDEYDNSFNILIDGGPLQTYKTTLVKKLPKLNNIDLVILTHIDEDHIAGLIEYLSSSFSDDNTFDKIIINAKNLARITSGTQITYSHGVLFEKKICEKHKNIKVITNITNKCCINLGLPSGIEIKILSPDKKGIDYLYEEWPNCQLDDEKNTQVSSNKNTKFAKDYDISFEELAARSEKRPSSKSDKINGSSIAFSIKTKDFSGLFLGDAHAKVVIDGMDIHFSTFPVSFDFVKLSHHGSKYNISKELLSRIDCNNFIISTNGGVGRAKHPDRETIAKIVQNYSDRRVNLIFNYPLCEIEKVTGKLFSKEEYELFNYKCENILS